MVKQYQNGETKETSLKVRIRLDFRNETRNRIFGGKNITKSAEDAREQHVSLLRNVPFQGIKIEDIDMGMESYVVFDEQFGEDVAFAPVIVTLAADTFEDMIKFIMREEFRKVEVIDPSEILFTKQDAERLLFEINMELQNYKNNLDKRYNLK